MDYFERETCVRGYHEYKTIWAAAIGEELECRREPTNTFDPCAVDGTVVGHLPRKESRAYSLFIRRGGQIKCLIIGVRSRSSSGSRSLAL